jgi:hypothetical protein
VLVQQLEPCEWGLVQEEGEVEALGVVVVASVLDGEGVAPEPLDGILLRVVLGDPQGFELVREEQVVKPRREGGDVVWTSLGPLPRWVPGPTTRWALGTTQLALHGT